MDALCKCTLYCLFIYYNINADLEPKTHHQTPMTCTYGFVILDTSKTVATEMEIQFLNT